jgi:predicted GNAT family acetyltransferase
MTQSKPETTGQQENRSSQGRFIPGTSGNPAGRPRGSRNHTTLAAQALLDEEAEQLTRAAIDKALEGDGVALRLCLERLIPPKRDHPIIVSIPKVTHPKHALAAIGQVIEAVKNGNLTPLEGQQMSELLEKWLKMVEVSEFTQRLDTLENQVAQFQSKI